MKKILATLLALMLIMSALPVMAEEHVCPANITMGEHYACVNDKVDHKDAACEVEGYDEYKCQEPNCAVGTFQVKIPALVHAVPAGANSVSITEATCEGEGSREWDACVNGAHKWIETIKPLGHAWEVKKDEAGNPVVVAPTCTDKGYTVYVCSRCQAEKQDDFVDAAGHKWAVNPEVVDPTNNLIWAEVDSVSCVDGGKLVKFTYCEVCHFKNIISTDSNYWQPLDHQAFLNDYIKKPADDMDDADYIEWLLNKVADDTTADNQILCEGHEIESETAPDFVAYCHPVDVIIDEPTCTEDGLLTLDCTQCDAKVEVVIPAYGHEYVYDVEQGDNKPTCLEDGKVLVSCDNGCGYEEQINITAPGKHNYDATKATYSQKKYHETIDHQGIDKIAKCIDYTEHQPCIGYTVTAKLKNGETFTFVIDNCTAEFDVKRDGDGKHDKSQENYAFRDSTCTEEGYEYFYCNKCGYSYGQTIPMKDHTLVSKVVTKPTCTEDGMIHWDCTVCKQTIKEQVVPMTGHHYVVTDHKDETCTTDGYDLYTCSYCGDNYKETIEKHHVAPDPEDIKPGENNNQAYKAPTCTETGLMSYECLVCHKAIMNEVIPALGHWYEGTAGIVDGEVWDVYVPATCQHGSYYTRKCTRCGHEEKTAETEKLGHLMAAENENGKKVCSLVLDTNNLPTCTSTGKAYYNCVVCGKLVEDFVMPALPHNEEIVWNEEKRVYEISCEKADWTKWDELMEDYLWDEIVACTENEDLAEEVYEKVWNELLIKIFEKDNNFISGIGCGATKEIPAIKTHYDIAIDGSVATLTPDDNCVLLPNPMLIVNWCYTMSDGTAFSYTRLIKADDLTTLTYDLGLAEGPAGSKLTSITVIVTDEATLDITVAAKGYGMEQF